VLWPRHSACAYYQHRRTIQGSRMASASSLGAAWCARGPPHPPASKASPSWPGACVARAATPPAKIVRARSAQRLLRARWSARSRINDLEIGRMAHRASTHMKALRVALSWLPVTAFLTAPVILREATIGPALNVPFCATVLALEHEWLATYDRHTDTGELGRTRRTVTCHRGRCSCCDG